MSTELSCGTMRDLEMALIALTDVDAESLSPELRAEYEAEVIVAVRATPEKRDAVAARIFSLEQRGAVKAAAAQAHEEKALELESEGARYEREAKRLGDYVLSVMAELPKPKRGVRTLEGTSATFRAKGVADSIDIYDETLLPDEFRTATVTMPLWAWQHMVSWCFSEDAQSHSRFAEVIRDISPKWGRVESSIIKASAQKLVTCERCGGERKVCMGCQELLSLHHKSTCDCSTDIDCPRCHGLGTTPTVIPGVRLVTGKLRLEVS